MPVTTAANAAAAIMANRTKMNGVTFFIAVSPSNAPAQPRRAHALVTSTPHLPPADGCSGLLDGAGPTEMLH